MPFFNRTLTLALVLELLALNFFLVIALHAMRYANHPITRLPLPIPDFMPYSYAFFLAFVPQNLAAHLLFRLATYALVVYRSWRRTNGLRWLIGFLDDWAEDMADLMFSPIEDWGWE